MPRYNFKCDSCNASDHFTMGVGSFLEFKKEEHICQSCNEGILIQMVRPTRGKIVRDKQAMIREAKDEARKIVERIESGDQKAFDDIYGDRENPHKKTK